jgi:aldehyde dehydrogenase (NAD+)
MDQPTVGGLAERQRAFFRAGPTRDVAFRRRQLRVLRNAIVEREADLLAALKADLGRPAAEAYSSEIAVVLHEIDFASRHLAAWARPRKVHTPLILFPGSSWIHPEPYGRALIISPWNYPFQLAVAPLVAALAAGNCAVVKPSEVAPRTSALIAEMLTAAFEPDYVAVVEGGAETVEALLAEQFDLIFFTGGPRVGRIVMGAAAKNLTPVVLELGGKNPCIVDIDADLDSAARRIAWGRFFNAGQTCIAPDFVLAHASIRAALLERLAAVIESFFGKDPQASPDYGRIINDHHVHRLAGLLGDGNITVGGRVDASDRYIAPTVLDNISWDAPIMQEEIFGPILPVLTFDDLNTAIEKLQQRPKPLALYFFSGNRMRQDEVLRRLSAGGVCINDTFSQMLNLRLPFGGVGESGMGAYHGKAGFDTFSHAKAVVRRAVWVDPGSKYPPYRTPLAALRVLLPWMF